MYDFLIRKSGRR